MAFYEMPDGRILEVSDDSVVAITHPAGHECPGGVQVGSARAAMMEDLINLDTYGDSVIVFHRRRRRNAGRTAGRRIFSLNFNLTYRRV